MGFASLYRVRRYNVTGPYHDMWGIPSGFLEMNRKVLILGIETGAPHKNEAGPHPKTTARRAGKMAMTPAGRCAHIPVSPADMRKSNPFFVPHNCFLYSTNRGGFSRDR